MIIQPMSDTASASFTATRLNGICPLPHLGVIRASGEDAARFLQGQLTQDVQHLPPGQARLAALCNPKGRMLASFWVLRRADDELLLITSADTLAATLKRLSMFVLRARLKLSDATSELALRGLIGDATISIAAGANQTSADSQNDAVSTIPLPAADGAPRALWLGPVGTPAPAAASLSSADWLAAEVRAGVARVTQPVVEAFVPQMLNYESVDGVHFQKGCYPGQEVVARSQFRGAIKRRAYVGHVDGAAQAGQTLPGGRLSFQRQLSPQCAHLADSSSPCICSTWLQPPRSCKSSTFCVTSSNSPDHSRSNRASALCAALGFTFASFARRSS